MLRNEKNTLIDSLKSNLEAASGVLFLDFTGITVAEVDRFRRTLQKSDIGYQVVKNTLMDRAMAGKPYSKISSRLKGTPTGVVFGKEDPVASAKVVFDFMKECEHLKVKAGIVEDQELAPAQAEELSKMPNKGQIQASIVQLALSPGRKVVGQIMAPAGKVVGAIEALVKRLGG